MWGFRNFEYLCIPVPVVQWIEFQIPVLKIGVRIPSGTQKGLKWPFFVMLLLV